MSTLGPETKLREDLDVLPGPLYRMPLEKYEEMVASGLFGPGDHVHLIDGYLVDKMTQNDAHATADELCGQLLDRTIPPGWHVRSAKPIRLAGHASKPEPDRCVARGGIRDYRHRSPEPQDIGLVVEVADSSLTLDRKLGRIYSAAGIPVYWILNLVDRQLEVYTEPGSAGYTTQRVFKSGDSAPLELDGREVGRILVVDVLP